MRAHASQIAMDGMFYAMADGGGRTMFSAETFRLIRGEMGMTGPDGREHDIFAGVSD